MRSATDRAAARSHTGDTVSILVAGIGLNLTALLGSADLQALLTGINLASDAALTTKP
jgi:uncharacterized protein (DUF2345 family)